MDRSKLLDGRLKLRHLVLVDVLTTHGSVISAAAALHITQPAATRTLRELEAILGVPLYERGPRGVTPTIFGETFTGHARAVLGQLTEAGRHVTQLADAHRSTVIVGTDLGGSNVLLLRAIARLKNERPQLTVVVREGSPESLSAELEAARIDLFVGRPAPTPGDAETRTPLYDESIAIFAREQHPWALRQAVTFADVVEYPWIVIGEGSALRRKTEQVFALHGMALPGNRIEVPSLLAVPQLLLQGDMVALLPGSIGHGNPGLHALPIPLKSTGNAVAVTTATGRTPNPAAQALLHTLQQLAAECSGDVRARSYGSVVPSRASLSGRRERLIS